VPNEYKFGAAQKTTLFFKELKDVKGKCILALLSFGGWAHRKLEVERAMYAKQTYSALFKKKVQSKNVLGSTMFPCYQIQSLTTEN
jgi:hypothetical protein